MKLLSKFILFVMVFYQSNLLKAQIFVRQAAQDDFEKIMQLDREVSFEFFKNLYQMYYSSYDFGKNPDYYLNKEMAYDETMFSEYIAGKYSDYGLLIAVDANKDHVVGLLLFHKESEYIGYLDLFLIDKQYRRQGVGRLLFASAMQLFDGMKEWIVEPFQLGNDATLQFYESLGFVNYGPVQDERLNSYGAALTELYFHFVKHLYPARRLYVQRKISATRRR